MRLLGSGRSLTSLRIVGSAALVALATACAVYDGDLSTQHRPDGSGASGGDGGASPTGNGGSAGTGGAVGTTSGSGGASGDGGSSIADAAGADADGGLRDMSLPPADSRADGPNDAVETSSPGDGSTDAPPPSDADGIDASDVTTSD